jgi:hypothetical protein
MTATRDLRNVPREKWGLNDVAELNDMRVGPDCFIGLQPETLSRRLKPEDCPLIAADIKAALSILWQIPWAKSPAIERVRFLDDFLIPFDD